MDSKMTAKQAWIYFLYFAAALIFITFSGAGCPFLRIFHIPCPTCGLTRATLALFRLDFKTSFALFPFAVPVLYSVFVIFFQRLGCLSKKAFQIPAYFFLAANFIWYIFKLINRL